LKNNNALRVIEYTDFFGLKLSSFTDAELLHTIDSTIIKKGKLICYGYNFGMFPYFRKYPEIPQYANQFDVLVADGRGYYLFAKLLGYPVKSDLSIPYMVNKVLELADKKTYSILLLGAKDEINKKATEKIRLKYPGSTVFEGHHGYFKEENEQQIVDFINVSKPDILLIGISSPMKERFAYKWRSELKCKIIIPCGGVIDILAGQKKNTPKIIKKMGFAWFYRFVQEPRRLFRDSILHTFSVFFVLIPCLVLQVYVFRKKFSIPEFYK
jgi:N-acetylglucosaminyldiphosphoundecaprenol N-acetyl-beta-D-mannosaminyltransferase